MIAGSDIGPELAFPCRIPRAIQHPNGWLHALTPDVVGMVFSFLAGLAALRWLSGWLERGHWHYFGIYCVFAAGIVLWVG